MILRLAWRNIWRQKRRSLITLLTVAGGTALCIFFTGLADGMYGKLTDMAVRLGTGHLVLESKGYREDPGLTRTVTIDADFLKRLDGLPGVVGSLPRISGPAILSSPYGTIGGSFEAVDPRLEGEVSLIKGLIVRGEYLSDRHVNGVIIGVDLARKLQVKVGSKVVVTTQDKEAQTVQELCRVVGVFRTKTPMVDGFYFQMALDHGRKMLGLGPGEVTQLGIFLGDGDDQAGQETAIRALGLPTGGTLVYWQKVLTDLSNYMSVDKASNFIMQALLFLIVLAGVLNTVLMSVMERTYELGVLISIGMSRAKVILMVLAECASLSLLGTFAGALVGFAENAILKAHPLVIGGDDFKTSIGGFFLEPAITMDVTTFHFLLTLCLVFAATTAMGFYPAWRAGRLEPVEALHAL